MNNHPIQPLYKDSFGVLRFKANAIVETLLERGPLDLNDLALMEFSLEDREQFAQLIGYSLSGFGELSYVSAATYLAATAMAETKATPEQARMQVAEDKLEITVRVLRELVPQLFKIHPDDLVT